MSKNCEKSFKNIKTVKIYIKTRKKPSKKVQKQGKNCQIYRKTVKNVEKPEKPCKKCRKTLKNHQNYRSIIREKAAKMCKNLAKPSKKYKNREKPSNI